MFAPAFLLTRPWGLHSGEDDGHQRIDLHDGMSRTLAAGCGFAVVAPDGFKMTFSGGKQFSAQPEGGAFNWSGRKRYWSLPCPSGNEAGRFRLLIEGDGNVTTAQIAMEDVVAEAKDPFEDTPNGRQQRLLLSLIEHVRSLIDEEQNACVEYHSVGRRLVGASVPWEVAEHIWCQDTTAEKTPPRDLIVQHAEELQRIVERLANHPRRVLNRIRERLPIARLQELDSACLEWYVRQPGTTATEKAGSRQSLLGVARHENFNTLENRVLRAYLRLAANAATSYSALYSALRRSQRMVMVERFGRVCRMLDRELAEVGITLPSQPIMPNYVLQQDVNYRRIWQGYLALLRRKEDVDNIWRWQGRLWAEFTRLSLLVALRSLPSARVLAETPLLVRNDQQRGRWVDISAHPAVVCVEIDGNLLAATVVDAQSEDGAEFGGEAIWDYLWSIGPACVIHAEDIDSGEQTWVLVWGIHPIDGSEMDLGREVKAADAALSRLRDRIRADGGGHVRLRGIVMVSHPASDAMPGEAEAKMYCGDTVAYRSEVSALSLKGMIDDLSEMLPVILGA